MKQMTNIEQIKMGGCYKTNDGWLIVGVKRDGTYQCRDIIVDEDGYDEEIGDFTESKIRKIADLSICYRPYYHREKGLYAVWDESKLKSEGLITLQNG